MKPKPSLIELFQKHSLSIILVIILVISFFLFMGIPLQDNNDGSDNIKEIYFADDMTESHKKTIEKFNEIYEGRIKVIPINLPFTKFTTNERKELLTRSFRSKSDKIDVFAVDLIWVSRFAKWAEPIGQYFGQSETDNIVSYALESCCYNDQLVSLPLKIDIGTMYYRKDLLEKLPGFSEIQSKLAESISWKDFIALNKKLGKVDNPFYIFPADSYEGLVCSFVESILNQDRKFFSNPDFKFSSPIPKRALQLLCDLVNKYKMTPTDVTNYNELQSCNHFISNNGLFIRYWPEFLADYNNYYRNSTITPVFERVPLPHFEGFQNASIFGGWNLMVSKFSDNKDAALEFLRFVISDEAQKIMMENGDALPVTKSFYENPENYSQRDILKFYDELFKSGVHRPYWEDYTRISDIIAYYANQAIKNKISVDNALLKMDEMIATGQVIIK